MSLVIQIEKILKRCTNLLNLGVIPVHGEHRHMIEHINFAKEMQVPHPVQVENGDIVKLYPVKT